MNGPSRHSIDSYSFVKAFTVIKNNDPKTHEVSATELENAIDTVDFKHAVAFICKCLCMPGKYLITQNEDAQNKEIALPLCGALKTGNGNDAACFQVKVSLLSGEEIAVQVKLTYEGGQIYLQFGNEEKIALDYTGSLEDLRNSIGDPKKSSGNNRIDGNSGGGNQYSTGTWAEKPEFTQVRKAVTPQTNNPTTQPISSGGWTEKPEVTKFKNLLSGKMNS